ncbi:unnamed protein product [Boreogadus saida]
MEEEDVHVENGFHASSKESDRQQRLRLCVLNEILNTERAYVRTLLFLQSQPPPEFPSGRVRPGPGMWPDRRRLQRAGGIPVRIMAVWLFWKGRSRNVRNPWWGESLPQQHPGVLLCPGPPSQSRLRPRFRTPPPRGYVFMFARCDRHDRSSAAWADRLSES